MREEAVERERVKHFNGIRSVILMKQEWRVKEKASTPTPMTSNGDMDLLDDDETLLIKDRSPPPTRMDINMVFTLPTEFMGAEDEVSQIFLAPRRLCLRSLKSQAST
jgi:hypothetical protein